MEVAVSSVYVWRCLCDEVSRALAELWIKDNCDDSDDAPAERLIKFMVDGESPPDYSDIAEGLTHLQDLGLSAYVDEEGGAVWVVEPPDELAQVSPGWTTLVDRCVSDAVELVCVWDDLDDWAILDHAASVLDAQAREYNRREVMSMVARARRMLFSDSDCTHSGRARLNGRDLVLEEAGRLKFIIKGDGAAALASRLDKSYQETEDRNRAELRQKAHDSLSRQFPFADAESVTAAVKLLVPDDPSATVEVTQSVNVSYFFGHPDKLTAVKKVEGTSETFYLVVDMSTGSQWLVSDADPHSWTLVDGSVLSVLPTDEGGLLSPSHGTVEAVFNALKRASDQSNLTPAEMADKVRGEVLGTV